MKFLVAKENFQDDNYILVSVKELLSYIHNKNEYDIPFGGFGLNDNILELCDLIDLDLEEIQKLQEIRDGLNSNEYAYISFKLKKEKDYYTYEKYDKTYKDIYITNCALEFEEEELGLILNNLYNSDTEEDWLNEDTLSKKEIAPGYYSYEEEEIDNDYMMTDDGDMDFGLSIKNYNIEKDNKGEDKMNSLQKLFGGKIGLVKENNVKIGMNMKIAIKSANGDYKTVDKGVLTNISDFAFDTGIFIMPKLISNVSVGDIIAKDNEYVYITAVNLKDKQYTGINYSTGQIATYTMQSHILLGQEYVRILTSMFDGMSNNNMLPLLLISGDNSFGNMFEDNKMSSLLMLNMFNNQNGTQNNNLLPLLLLGKDTGKDNNMMEMFMMMQMFNGNFNLFQQSSSKITDSDENPTV